MKGIDSSLLDKAIKYAVDAHSGVERRGKDFPYIVHPMEAVAIVSTMTSDQELLAAAALHDVVEDTDQTFDDIKVAFNERIANLVASESDIVVEGKSASESWKERKQAAITRLKNAPIDAKKVALGDKLSNIRAIKRDYFEQGDSFWKLFHESDPRLHEWHYRGLVDSLSDLKDTDAWKEFASIVDEVFLDACKEFSFDFDANDCSIINVHGYLNGNCIEQLVAAMDKSKSYTLNYKFVGDIDNSAIAKIKELGIYGYKIKVINVQDKVLAKLAKQILSDIVK